ncbi:MAG TPA: YbhB/YbcL family Raf kinase inhibitor-like protein [Caulobacteraceae bacterium]
MRFAIVLLISIALAGCGKAQPKASNRLILGAVAPRDPAPMALSLGGGDVQGRVAERHSAYGANLSPPLAWTPVAGAAAYALVVEDPDAPGLRPFVHWLIWNVPAGVSALAEGVAAGAALPAGVIQGSNGAGSAGYFGPRPPAGSGLHHYHFEIFALDRPLALAPGAEAAAFGRSLQGHVLAKGETVATFEAPRN